VQLLIYYILRSPKLPCDSVVMEQIIFAACLFLAHFVAFGEKNIFSNTPLLSAGTLPNSPRGGLPPHPVRGADGEQPVPQFLLFFGQKSPPFMTAENWGRGAGRGGVLPQPCEVACENRGIIRFSLFRGNKSPPSSRAEKMAPRSASAVSACTPRRCSPSPRTLSGGWGGGREI